MITPLRRRHRWLAPGMFFVALAGLLAAVAVRPSRAASIAEAGVSNVWAADAQVLEHGSGRFRVAVSPLAQGARDVWLLPTEALDVPDLLVYAAQNSVAQAPAALPGDARLLGPAAQAAPTRFRVSDKDRALLLFSLAHQEVKLSISLDSVER